MTALPTLVLIPGLLCDAHVWQPQRDELSAVATILIADHGDADRLDAMAEAALGMCGGPIAVAGHSMGARVAVEMWRQAPERVTRLALLSTGADGVNPGEPDRRKQLTDLSATAGMEALTDAWLPPMVHPERHGDDSLMAPLRAMVGRFTPQRHARQIAALVHRRELWSLLPTITVPTLVAVGRQDQWRDVDHHRSIAELIPGSRMEIIEDSGHMATVEQPDAVTRLLRDWLTGGRIA